MNILKGKTGIFLILTFLFLIIAIFLNKRFVNTSYESINRKVEKTLCEKEKDISLLMDQGSIKYRKEGTVNQLYKGLFHDKGFIILIYENDSIKYWSGNRPSIPDTYQRSGLEKPFVKLGSGWFEVRKMKKGNVIIAGLILIYSDYHYENDFLVNGYQNDFAECENAGISTMKSNFPVFSGEKQFLFSMVFTGERQKGKVLEYVLVILYILCFMFFMALMFRAYRKISFFSSKPGLMIIAYAISILIIRGLLFYYRIPVALYETALFSPASYAISLLLPSLGDMLVNVLIVSYIFFLAYKYIKEPLPGNKMWYKWRNVFASLAFIMIILLFYSLIYFIQSLIFDSSIPLSLSNIFSLNELSIILFFIIATLILCFVLAGIKLMEVIYKVLNSTFLFLFISGLALVIGSTFLFYTGVKDMMPYVLLLIFIFSFLIIRKKSGKIISYSLIIVYIIIFTVLTTYILNISSNRKEKEKRKSMIMTIAEERDPIAEFLFHDIETKALKDSTLNRMLDSVKLNEAVVIAYLEKVYFNGFWRKYRKQFTICRDQQKLLVKPYYLSVGCDAYFQDKIETNGEKSISKNFYFLNYGYTSYVGKLFFTHKPDGDNGVNIYIELDIKTFTGDLGYPELLIDKSMDINPDIGNYSYARYDHGILVKKTGKYEYSSVFNLGNPSEEMSFLESDNYNHLVYKTAKGSVYVLSKKNDDFLTAISPFSYMFIFFSLYVLFFIGIMQFSAKISFTGMSYSMRLQLSVISIVLLSFVGIGTATVIYIFNINKNKNTDILSEKTRSLLIELKSKLGDETKINPTPQTVENIQNMLVKFSNIFFTDINIYGINGKLIASSRPEIFEEELISERMNSSAYSQLTNNKKLLFIQEENIGKQRYLSSYAPFENYYGEIIAYLNLPYFAKQSVIRKEISGFLMAYTNFYILLIALIIIITLVISNYITYPLQLISQNISRIKFGKKNEKIIWSKKDEIGNLIHEYNRMIDELEKSAVLLAQSERESAWRDMAKQVAHEIKNPLTPMKLSIQHLEKAWQQKVPDMDERVKKITKTLIEQIESLAAIATEFSDFAKMPSARQEKIDLTEVIHAAAEMYYDLPNIRISLPEKDDKFYIFADKKQIIRVLNNLLSNSLEAIGNKPDGAIWIDLKTEKSMHLLHIGDNGIGIDENQKKYIFTPDFTTKTAGTGLGLTMVRSIIIEAGGEIGFVSEKGEGDGIFN